MKIIYKHGNILDNGETFVVQGCNAQGVMGSGLAKEIRDRFPQVFTEYRAKYEEQGDRLDLGQLIWVDVEFDHGEGYVINAITQQFYGRDKSVLYASYDAIRLAVRGINAILEMATDTEYRAELVGVVPVRTRVAFPLIGCGLANGDWSIVSRIIEEESTNIQPVVYLYDGRLPDGSTPDFE